MVECVIGMLIVRLLFHPFMFPGNVQKSQLPPKAFEFFGIKWFRSGNVQKASGVPTGGLKEEKDEAALSWGPPQISLYRGSSALQMFHVSDFS